MLIGQFCDTYPPTVDGVGRVTQSYCETLASMGHTAYYVGPSSPYAKDAGGVPVILSASLPVPGELFRMGLPKLDWKYRAKVDSVPFDLVHAHDPFIAGGEALRIARKRGIPLVSTFHSKYQDDFRAKTHSEALAKLGVKIILDFYNKCDSVWTVNHATAEVLKGYGYKRDILVMENGTNAEEPSGDARKRLSGMAALKEGLPTLLFVGQHNYKKNLHGVLGACAILKREGQPFQMLTAGDGPDFKDIQDEARDLGLGEDCRFLGFVNDRDLLMAIYERADLLVFPSLYDNAPMVLREAAATGTPGLVVKGSCSAEGVTDGVNGFVSPDESAEAIAATILRALPGCRAVGEAARATIPVPWDRIMKQVTAEYERLIAEKKRKGANA
ncbi:MAG: glycosyltransferase [Clostridia bacterium]|nr:glycosyltransferase [Clostridia bacterium]